MLLSIHVSHKLGYVHGEFVVSTRFVGRLQQTRVGLCHLDNVGAGLCKVLDKEMLAERRIATDPDEH